MAQYSLAKLYLSDDVEVRDIRQGMNWLYTAAVNGSSYAMYRLAKELLKGELIKKNTAAVEWFTRSAERGNPYAQYMLGKLYLTGKEAPYDEERAVHWLTRSAEQGQPVCTVSPEPLGGKPSALCDAGGDPAAPSHEPDLPGQLRPQVPPRRNPDRPQAAEKAAGEAHGPGS